MRTHWLSIAFITFLLILNISCVGGPDDDPPMDAPITEDGEEQPDNPTPEEALATERNQNKELLTSRDSQTWRFKTATLKNNFGEFSMESFFNVQDDEFIFEEISKESKGTEFEGRLIWNPGFEFDVDAENQEQIVTEQYASPFVSTFDFSGNSGNTLNALEGEITLTIEEGEVSGLWDVGEGILIEFTLTIKTEADYPTTPKELNFIENLTVQSNAIQGFAPSLLLSRTNENIYFSTRERALGNGAENPERVDKINTMTGETSRYLNFTPDLVSKQMNIKDNQLYVAGGSRITVYDLDLSQAPEQLSDYNQASGLPNVFSRFGTAVNDEYIYLIGGDIDNIHEPSIWQYNLNNQTMIQWLILPEDSFGARAEIVNGYLYIFGGTNEVFGNMTNNFIYKINLESKELTTLTLPQPLHYSFTGKIDNLIYVSGQILVEGENQDGEIIIADTEPFLGVFDTRTDSLIEIKTNLSSPEDETIHGMAISPNKIYLLYGQFEEVEEGELQTWNILEADLPN